MKKNYILVCLLAACAAQSTYTIDDFDDFTDLDNFILPQEEATSIAANAQLEMLAMTRKLQHGQYYNAWFSTILIGTDIINNTNYGLGKIALKSTLLSDWYYNTDPIATRNILQYPFNIKNRYALSENHTIDFNIFWNKTNQKYFTPTSYTIESYVNVKNANFDDILQSFAQSFPSQFTPVTQASILNTLDTLGNGTIEERRMGGTLGYSYIFNDWMLYAQLPIFYAERNFQYTQAEKDIIQASPLFQGLTGGGGSFKDFAYDHFVMDQAGLGTLQIGFTKKIHENDADTFHLDIGLYTQLPNEWSIQQGIAGTWFEPTDTVQPLDLSAINPTHLTNDQLSFDERNEVKRFFLGAIDHLASNLLRCELGNKRHFNIGGTLNLSHQPHERIQFLGDLQVQYYFKAQEQRFFMQRPTGRLNILNQQINAIPGLPGGVPNDLQIALVNQVTDELYHRFILSVYKTEVIPGMMFNTNLKGKFEILQNHNLHLTLGVNGWLKLKEKLGSISAQTEILPYLDTVAATGYTMYQLKPYISFDYTQSSWVDSISLYADYTVAQRAIGKDYTISLCMNWNF
jgi:hypothetical protein